MPARMWAGIVGHVEGGAYAAARSTTPRDRPYSHGWRVGGLNCRSRLGGTSLTAWGRHVVTKRRCRRTIGDSFLSCESSLSQVVSHVVALDANRTWMGLSRQSRCDLLECSSHSYRSVRAEIVGRLASEANVSLVGCTAIKRHNHFAARS